MPARSGTRRSASASAGAKRDGARVVGGATGQPHSTVWKVLRRHGLSRPPRAPKQAADRYEWPRPGDLLHMDTACYARFKRPGHAVTGDCSQRSRNWMSLGMRVGYDYAHAIVDDHSRLAYVELLADEKAATITGFTRALAWFDQHSITAKRLMTDNAWSYTHNRSLRELSASARIKHLTTQPYRPRINGKVEPFPQIMAANGPTASRRMGLRPRVQLTPPPQPSPVTLEPALQPAQTPQLNRSPTTDQPRSQPTWAGRLASIY
jgi:transposase InsO family protein